MPRVPVVKILPSLSEHKAMLRVPVVKIPPSLSEHKANLESL